MKLHIQRTIQFLRLNKNHYFEVSDIAFHLKMDEINAESALKYLAARDLVKSSHDTFGKVVWYAAEYENQCGEKPLEQVEPEKSEISKRIFKQTSNQNVIVDNNGSSINHAKKNIPLIAGLSVAIIAILLVSGVFWAKWYIDKRFSTVMDVARSAVPMQEYVAFREQCIQRDERMRQMAAKLYLQIDTVDKKIDTVSNRIDVISQSTQSIKNDVSRIRKLLKRR